jgi:hypothetical protein
MIKKKPILNKGSFFKSMHEHNKKEMNKKYKKSTVARKKFMTSTAKKRGDTE